MGKQYDYIISGAGCAGLSLLMRMISSGKFSDKKILLIDQSEKKVNDRTWCFWEKEPGFFDGLVYHQWKNLWFHSKKDSRLLNIDPYSYKMIRGIDFYDYCFDRIRQQKNIDLIFGKVEAIKSDAGETFLLMDGEKIRANYIFNSIRFQQPTLQKKDFLLLQHFKGWVIEASGNVFSSTDATLMDFRVSQEYGMGFFYVLPFSSSKALVEFTLFSEKLLPAAVYDQELENYLNRFYQTIIYSKQEEEFGIIPMTNYQFPSKQNNIIHIGMAGGQTKPSSGYTFQFIQKQSEALVRSMVANGVPQCQAAKKRFHFYDSVLLNVISTGKISGENIFANMFSKNKPTDIFKFLDNESHWLQDIGIIQSLPTKPFLQAALQQIF
ncbi:MAG: lycopene cyclase [Bacteroidetes bacterium]|nr:lycopene cyclase [Bacteroidota bacterium]